MYNFGTCVWRTATQWRLLGKKRVSTQEKSDVVIALRFFKRKSRGKTGVTADRDKIQFRLFNSCSIFNITLCEELFSFTEAKINHAFLSWFCGASHLSQVPWREFEGHYSPSTCRMLYGAYQILKHLSTRFFCLQTVYTSTIPLCCPRECSHGRVLVL